MESRTPQEGEGGVMIEFNWFSFGIGIMAGTVITIFVLSLCLVSKRSDERAKEIIEQDIIKRW